MQYPSDLLDRVATLQKVARALTEKHEKEAARILEKEYPDRTIKKKRKRLSKEAMLRVFLRDGFIDRYSGEKLILPGALRLISHLLEKNFPYHRHGKSAECHFAYFELQATVDHFHPKLGAADDALSNLISTSTILKRLKKNYAAYQSKLSLHQKGNLDDWDGMTGWFVAYMNKHEGLNDVSYLRDWYRIASKKVEPAPELVQIESA